MRRIADRIGFVCVIALILFVSACSIKSVRKDSGTAPTGSGTTTRASTATQTGKPSPTKKPTATPTPTRKPTPTSKPTATPKPTVSPTPTPNPLNKYTLQEGFLLKDVSAKDTEGKVKFLKTGSLICIFSREEEIIDGGSRFFLTDYYSASSSKRPDNEVFFEISENRLGAVCFSGIPDHELFGTGESVYSDKRAVIEVEPGTQVKRISEAERYLMRIDWDRDGYEDEVSFALAEARNNSYHLICQFRSGKDGSSIRVRLSPDLNAESDDYGVFPETLILTQKANGDYAVVVCADLSAYVPWAMGMKSWALSYSADDVFLKNEISGLFEYQDGLLYKGFEGQFFAWYTKTKTAVQINEDLSCTYLSGTHYFLNYGDPITYLLLDMQVQIFKDTRYIPETLSAGTFIIPDRIEMNSSDEGFFYFCLLDGRRARIHMETSQETEIFYGKPYSEVFYFLVCG